MKNGKRKSSVSNPSVQKRQKTAERLAKNIAANKATAEKEFPDETWVGTDNLKLKHVSMPKDAIGIFVARSRLPINKQEELDFLKEIKSAIILRKHGSSVILIPRVKDLISGRFLSGPDAIVDGTFFEFKEVTGSIDKIGARFLDSRRQENNVYIRVANSNLSKRKVFDYFGRYVNNKNYKGGYKGNIIFSFGDEQRTYFFKIKDFKKP